jgi:hypothetical protein
MNILHGRTFTTNREEPFIHQFYRLHLERGMALPYKAFFSSLPWRGRFFRFMF